MLFYYIRHGDPIYSPDSLTPLGERQAEALGKRLSRYGFDKIFASSSDRAKMTAQPTCEMLKKEMEILDWANEGYAWEELGYLPNYPTTEGKCWLFQSEYIKNLLVSKEIKELGFEWYKHPAFSDYKYKEGIERVKNETVKLLASFGFCFDEEKGLYIHKEKVASRVALFAHHGFGMAFLSCVLNLPYPQMCLFDMQHSGMTVIEFPETEYSVPTVLTLSNDSHLYREGLPTKYNNYIYI